MSMPMIMLRGKFLGITFPHYDVSQEVKEEFAHKYLKECLKILRSLPSCSEDSHGNTFVFYFKSDVDVLSAMKLCPKP